MTDTPDGDVAHQKHAFVPPDGYPNKTLCAVCNLGEAAHIVPSEEPTVKPHEIEWCTCGHQKGDHDAAMCCTRCNCTEWDPGDASGRLQEVTGPRASLPFPRPEDAIQDHPFDRPPHTHVIPNVLEEAHRAVYGSRQATHGSPGPNLRRAAVIWTEILGVSVTADQVALCMVGFKLSREVSSHNRENLIDLAGYAEIRQMLEEE